MHMQNVCVYCICMVCVYIALYIYNTYMVCVLVRCMITHCHLHLMVHRPSEKDSVPYELDVD